MSHKQRYMSKVAEIGCVICRQHGYHTPAEIHHIAEGSGKRSDYMIAPLCPEHHRGATGFHGGTKRFLVANNLPTEFHLMGLVNEYMES